MIPVFSVVLAFDSSTARERAMGLMEFLNQQFGARTNLNWTQCEFQQLEDRRFYTEAIDVAASANMVILATTDGEQLPVAVKGWMEEWLTRRNDREGALVATVQNAGEEPKETRVHSYLQNAAMKAGIKFFAGAF